MRSRLTPSWRCRSGLALAQQHEQEVEQVLQRGTVQQRLDVRGRVVRGHRQRRIGVGAQRVGGVPGDRHHPALAGWNWRLICDSCGSWPNSENTSSTSPGRAAERLAIIRIGSAWCTTSTPSSDRRMANSRANRPSSPSPQTNTLPAPSTRPTIRSIPSRGLSSRVSSSAAALLRRRLSSRLGVLVAVAGRDGLRRCVGAGARHRLTDAVLQVRVAAEAELLAELDHRGLADAQRTGQLLR